MAEWVCWRTCLASDSLCGIWNTRAFRVIICTASPYTARHVKNDWSLHAKILNFLSAYRLSVPKREKTSKNWEVHICLVRQRARFLYTFYDRLGSGEQNVHTIFFFFAAAMAGHSRSHQLRCWWNVSTLYDDNLYLHSHQRWHTLVYNTCTLTWIFAFVLELFIIYSTRVSVKYSVHSLAFVCMLTNITLCKVSLWFVAAAAVAAAAPKDTNSSNSKKTVKTLPLHTFHLSVCPKGVKPKAKQQLNILRKIFSYVTITL